MSHEINGFYPFLFMFYFQFDTKSSPLALLAQTCSAIGSDATPNPKLLANIEKSNKMRDKISPAGSNGSPHEFRSSFKPYESSLRDNDMPDDLRVASRLKAAKGLTSPHHMNGNSNHNNHNNNNNNSSSVNNNNHHTSNNNNNNSHSSSERCESATRKSPPSASPKTLNEKLSSTSSNSSSASAKSTTPTSIPANADAAAHSSKSSSNEKDGQLRSIPTGPYPMPYLNGYPYGAYQMELLAQQQSMLKAAALNPYLNYARMKAAAGAGSDMMMGICRDPYCTGCNLGSHLMGSKNGSTSSCPPGCTCDHSMSKAMAANPAAAMAYHAQLAQLAAASQMPYV
jgi:hypothetical protein